MADPTGREQHQLHCDAAGVLKKLTGLKVSPETVRLRTEERGELLEGMGKRPSPRWCGPRSRRGNWAVPRAGWWWRPTV